MKRTRRSVSEITGIHQEELEITSKTQQKKKINEFITDLFVPHIISYGGFMPDMRNGQIPEKEIVDFFNTGVYLHYPINVKIPSEMTIKPLSLSNYTSNKEIEFNQLPDEIIYLIIHQPHPIGGPQSLIYRMACSLARTSKRLYRLMLPKIVEICRFCHFIRAWVGQVAFNTIYYSYGFCQKDNTEMNNRASPTWAMDFYGFTNFCERLSLHKKSKDNDTTHSEDEHVFKYTSGEFLRWEYIIGFYLSRLSTACGSEPNNKALLDIVFTLLTFLPRNIKHHYKYIVNWYLCSPPDTLANRIPPSSLMEIFDTLSKIEFFSIPAMTTMYNLFSKAILLYGLRLASSVRKMEYFMDITPLYYIDFLGCQSDLSDYGWDHRVIEPGTHVSGISGYKVCSRDSLNHWRITIGVNYIERFPTRNEAIESVRYLFSCLDVKLELYLTSTYQRFLSGPKKLFVHNITDTDSKMISIVTQNDKQSRRSLNKDTPQTIFYGKGSHSMICWTLMCTFCEKCKNVRFST